MARSIEKLMKIETPKQINKLDPECLKEYPLIPKLNLMDIESFSEPGVPVNIDLGLDQMEEEEK